MPGTGSLTAVAEQAGQLKQVQQAFQTFQVARAAFINSLSVRTLTSCWHVCREVTIAGV